jgi:hypothetical protein
MKMRLSTVVLSVMLVVVFFAYSAQAGENFTFINDSENITNSEISEISEISENISFHTDVNPENFEIEKNNESVVISLTNETAENSEQIIGIPLNYTKDGICVITHTDEAGVNTSTIHYGLVQNDTVYLNVEFSTVTIYPMWSVVNNYDFETWTYNGNLGTSGFLHPPNAWGFTSPADNIYMICINNTSKGVMRYQTAEPTVSSPVYSEPDYWKTAHGRYAYGMATYVDGRTINPIETTLGLAGSTSVNNQIHAGSWIVIDAWILIGKATSGTLNIDICDNAGLDMVGLRQSANTNNQMVHIRTNPEYVENEPPNAGNVKLRVFVDGAPNKEAIWIVDRIMVSDNTTNAGGSGYQADENISSSVMYQNFTFYNGFPIDGSLDNILQTRFTTYAITGHGNTTTTVYVDGNVVPSDVMGEDIYFDAPKTTGAHNVVVKVDINAPVLISPISNTTINHSSPTSIPVDLRWFTTSGITNPSYEYRLFEGTSLLYSDQTTNNYTTTQLLPGTYNWQVRNFDPSLGIWATWCDLQYFTVSQPIPVNGTGVKGIIYDAKNGLNSPISGAIVTISNNTWSKIITTGSNGSFNCTLPLQGAYSLYATADKYDASASYPFQSNGTFADMNLPMKSSASYFYPHYVKYTVRNMIGTVYTNVYVSVYEGTSTTPFTTGRTKSDGSVTFALDPNKEYRLTFSDPEQNINTNRVMYPTDAKYDIIVYTAQKKTNTTITEQDQPTEPKTVNDLVKWSYSTNITNETYAYINTTVQNTDNDSQITWNTSIYNVSAKNGTVYGLVWSKSENMKNNTSALLPRGNTYMISTTITHPKITGTIKRIGTVSLPSTTRRINMGFDDENTYNVMAVILMILVACIFGYNDTKLGGIVLCGCGCIFLYIGWLPINVVSGSLATLAGLLVFFNIIGAD